MKLRLLIILMFLSNTAHAGPGSRFFDGSNDEMDWGDVNNTTTGNRTVCGWFYMTEDASADAMMGRKNDLVAATVGYMISQNTSDVVTFNVADGVESVTSTATTDIDEKWRMVCGVWSASDETTYIYVNGVEEDTDVGGGSVDSLNNAVEFAVGETGAEGDDASGYAGWLMTSANIWTPVEINEARWHIEGRYAASGVGASGMLVPAWLGASPELDIENAFDATVSGAVAAAASPPIMLGALGASY